jgi:predicted metal-dependent hydrolase
VLNVLHILLPEGERWFVKVFAEALPLIKDDRLREDVLGFIGQEGMPACAHQGVQDYFKEQGLDTTEYVADLERCTSGRPTSALRPTPPGSSRSRPPGPRSTHAGRRR